MPLKLNNTELTELRWSISQMDLERIRLGEILCELANVLDKTSRRMEHIRDNLAKAKAILKIQ